jgi:Protein of unknown function (DUF3558)
MTKIKIGGVAAVLAALFAVLLLSACGGGGPDSATAEGSKSSSEAIVKSNDKVTDNEGFEEITEARFPNGHDTDEKSASGRQPIKPCSFVSPKQANEILGGHVKISEHPQGPTCVYKGSGREITVVLSETSLKPIISGARNSRPMTIAGHHAYCVRYETTSVVAGVGKGRVLQITGSCQAASRFAALAIPKILKSN